MMTTVAVFMALFLQQFQTVAPSVIRLMAASATLEMKAPQHITPVIVATSSMEVVLVCVRLMERGLGVLQHVNVSRLLVFPISNSNSKHYY